MLQAMRGRLSVFHHRLTTLTTPIPLYFPNRTINSINPTNKLSIARISMATPVTAPFGQWKSPISSALLGASGVQFESIAVCSISLNFAHAQNFNGAFRHLTERFLSSRVDPESRDEAASLNTLALKDAISYRPSTY